MTRKHFEAIASAIKNAQFAGDAGKHQYERKQCAEIIAEVCADANPRFDYVRFMEACGITKENIGV